MTAVMASAAWVNAASGIDPRGRARRHPRYGNRLPEVAAHGYSPSQVEAVERRTGIVESFPKKREGMTDVPPLWETIAIVN
jgi:hypothetical protein